MPWCWNKTMCRFSNKNTTMCLSLNHVCVSFPNSQMISKWRVAVNRHCNMSQVALIEDVGTNNAKDNNVIMTITIEDECSLWNWSWKKQITIFLRTHMLYDAKLQSSFVKQVTTNPQVSLPMNYVMLIN